MTDLMAARTQMAISLGFHIIFASIGIAMPFLMSISYWKWIKTKDPVYLTLTQAWSKGVAIFFATGAVSGTVLSFELGLLWPKFMLHAGPIIGMPFSWEGAAFFLEAIAFGIFLYGWKRVPTPIHFMSALAVGITGVLSGLFVVCANAWMNTPTGFDWVQGRAENIDPWAAMFNPSAWGEGVHMILAAFEATGFAVAGIHAYGWLKNRNSKFHRRACEIGLTMGAITALIQPLSGDLLAKNVAVFQPVKLAAMESLFKTSRPAALIVGGIPDEEHEVVNYGIHIPHLLSFLAYGDLNAEVKGLDSVTKEDRPPVAPVHFAFQIMVALGTALAALGIGMMIYFKRLKKRAPRAWTLKLLVLATPLGFLAMETGWVVTEVGRQPWIIYHLMRTSEAVTPMPGLTWIMFLYSGIYIFLAFVVSWLLVRQFKNVEKGNHVAHVD
jgi:cytochrome d ubiquinol oxidase subunit I